MSDGVLGALVGVMGTVAGTLLGYVLSRRAAVQEEKRTQRIRRHEHLVELVEELLLRASDLAIEVLAGTINEDAIVGLLPRMRIVEAHSGIEEPDLARLMRDLRKNMPTARLAKRARSSTKNGWP